MSEYIKNKNQDAKTNKGKLPIGVEKTMTVPVVEEQDDAPPLTQELLASYQDSHYGLLFLLSLILAFVLACFPISDPEIFSSLLREIRPRGTILAGWVI
jgi:hypothetical protein